MDFEETIYKIVRRKADIQRRRFIRKYGTLKNMTELGRKVYKKKYENVTEHAIKGFNKRMNCGGYALEIDSFLLPNGDSLSGYVSSILERYKFVRLLGDMPLQDDEYLVFYRFYKYTKNQGKNKGHHFIKVNDDGLVVEKCGDGAPRIFESWDENYTDSPEVVFAVKKDHNGEIDPNLEKDFKWLKIEAGLDFQGSVERALLQKSNQFEYHGHLFRLKKSVNQVYVTTEEGKIVANVVIEREKFRLELRKNQEDYVENLSGPVKPIIKNGKLINIDEFKKIREDQDREL